MLQAESVNLNGNVVSIEPSVFFRINHMATAVSKHAFEWRIGNLSDGDLDSRMFNMRVGSDLVVKCNAFFSHSQQVNVQRGYRFERCLTPHKFTYELEWADCESQPLLYSSDVQVRRRGIVVWSDKKVAQDGGHVSSSAGEATLQGSNGNFKVDFYFEFTLPITKSGFLTVPLFEMNILCDFIVACEGQGHKAILAGRSVYFMTMLSSGFKEAEENITIVKEFSPNVTKLLIDFIYYDDVAEDAVTWELFEMAKMYLMPGLMSRCLSSLRKSLNVNSCCALLVAAFKHDLEELFEYGVEFLKRNKSAVAATDGWNAVKENNGLLEKICLTTK